MITQKFESDIVALIKHLKIRTTEKQVSERLNISWDISVRGQHIFLYEDNTYSENYNEQIFKVEFENITIDYRGFITYDEKSLDILPNLIAILRQHKDSIKKLEYKEILHEGKEKKLLFKINNFDKLEAII